MSSSSLLAHQARREQGYPVISALRGPLGAGIRCWRIWCSASGRTCVVSRGIESRRWVADYVHAFLRERDPFRMARQTLAERLKASADSLLPSRLTLPKLGRLCDQAGLNEAGADRLCRRFLEAEVKGESLSPDAVFQWFCHDSAGESWLETFGAIVDFCPKGLSPALLVLPINEPRDSSGDSARLENVAHQLASLISRIPAASVGLCAGEVSFEDYFQTAPESYSKAVLRESLVSVSGLSARKISHRVSDRLMRPASDWDKQIQLLAARGASPDLVDRFIEAVMELDLTERRGQPPDDAISESAKSDLSPTVKQLDAARSAAERFLYEMLECIPDLAGLFELNVKPGFDFGGRPAEIDLACLSKHIAVEIDGYHHFTDPAAYRRDRRKDALLQEQGFFVLRFLAEDVVSDMEFICETILSVVQLRK